MHTNMQLTMRAIWLEDQILSMRNDLEIPRLLSGEALIRIRLAGICATDLEMVKGYYPFKGILGHEFVGEVVQAPEYPAWQGHRVVGEINLSCGNCQACREGRPTHCEQRSVLGILNRHGVFAEYVALPLVNLHRVSPLIPDEAAVFTEPLAAALEILEQVPIRPSDRVLVVGAGRLGQLIAQVMSLTGCSLQVVTRYSDQGEILERRGIRTVSEKDLSEKKFDIVVEATGSPSGFSLARAAVRPRGVLVLKSTFRGEHPLNLSPLVVDEVTLVGSRCGPFPPALRLLEEGRIDPTPLISARYPIEQGLQAIEQAQKPGILKVLLEC
jgi:threonine dehydrogenase-like Zn-dependent dehydrogenase